MAHPRKSMSEVITQDLLPRILSYVLLVVLLLWVSGPIHLMISRQSTYENARLALWNVTAETTSRMVILANEFTRSCLNPRQTPKHIKEREDAAKRLSALQDVFVSKGIKLHFLFGEAPVLAGRRFNSYLDSHNSCTNPPMSNKLHELAWALLYPIQHDLFGGLTPASKETR